VIFDFFVDISLEIAEGISLFAVKPVVPEGPANGRLTGIGVRCLGKAIRTNKKKQAIQQ
jgi:hypothetical protein